MVTDERESVQKKTFQKWVNSHLVRVSCRISDLYVDLRDGKMLLKLLEVLSGERLVSGEICVCVCVCAHACVFMSYIQSKEFDLNLAD